LRFSRKRQDGSAPIFFQDLGENIILFITTCIENHYTGPLKQSCLSQLHFRKVALDEQKILMCLFLSESPWLLKYLKTVKNEALDLA